MINSYTDLVTVSMFIKNALITSTILLAVATSAQATTTTYDFRIPGSASTETGTGYNNALDFGDLTINAWSTTGVPYFANYQLDNAQIDRFSTGLGVCDKSDGLDCYNPDHQVDNVEDDDYVLFLFDNQVQFDNIVIDSFDFSDNDVSYWIADVTNPVDLTGTERDDLINGTTIFGAMTDIDNPKSSGSFNLSLGGATGNALLFAARSDTDIYSDNDYFKITSLTTTTVVPVPAAVWLFGSGLLGLVGVARRKTA